MSELRRERREEKEKAAASSQAKWIRWAIFVVALVTLRRAIYAVLIMAAFAVAYFLGNRSQHKYDGFARCLTDRGVKMYGAFWCPHCTEQKEKFGASFEYAPYVECGVKGQTSGKMQVCQDAGIQHYPTWQFPPTGERVERVFSLDELSDRSGCPLP